MKFKASKINSKRWSFNSTVSDILKLIYGECQIIGASECEVVGLIIGGPQAGVHGASLNPKPPPPPPQTHTHTQKINIHEAADKHCCTFKKAENSSFGL